MRRIHRQPATETRRDARAQCAAQRLVGAPEKPVMNHQQLAAALDGRLDRRQRRVDRDSHGVDAVAGLDLEPVQRSILDTVGIQQPVQVLNDLA